MFGRLSGNKLNSVPDFPRDTVVSSEIGGKCVVNPALSL